MPFASYDAAMKEKLIQTFVDMNDNEQQKYPKATKLQLAKEYRRLRAEGERKCFVKEEDATASMPPELAAARLYGNPKVHEEVREELGILPLREIVSCSGSNSEGLGKLVDSFTWQVDESCASFLQDTPHLLRQIRQLNTKGSQPEGTFIFSLDLVVLYPSVPTSRGTEVMRKGLLKAGLSAKFVDWPTHSSQALL
jgi:hypothetical protein